jgi:hypothetical protein
MLNDCKEAQDDNQWQDNTQSNFYSNTKPGEISKDSGICVRRTPVWLINRILPYNVTRLEN